MSGSDLYNKVCGNEKWINLKNDLLKKLTVNLSYLLVILFSSTCFYMVYNIIIVPILSDNYFYSKCGCRICTHWVKKHRMLLSSFYKMRWILTSIFISCIYKYSNFDIAYNVVQCSLYLLNVCVNFTRKFRSLLPTCTSEIGIATDSIFRYVVDKLYSIRM